MMAFLTDLDRSFALDSTSWKDFGIEMDKNGVFKLQNVTRVRACQEQDDVDDEHENNENNEIDEDSDTESYSSMPPLEECSEENAESLEMIRTQQQQLKDQLKDQIDQLQKENEKLKNMLSDEYVVCLDEPEFDITLDQQIEAEKSQTLCTLGNGMYEFELQIGHKTKNTAFVEDTYNGVKVTYTGKKNVHLVNLDSFLAENEYRLRIDKDQPICRKELEEMILNVIENGSFLSAEESKDINTVLTHRPSNIGAWRYTFVYDRLNRDHVVFDTARTGHIQIEDGKQVRFATQSGHSKVNDLSVCATDGKITLMNNTTCFQLCRVHIRACDKFGNKNDAEGDRDKESDVQDDKESKNNEKWWKLW